MTTREQTEVPGKPERVHRLPLAAIGLVAALLLLLAAATAAFWLTNDRTRLQKQLLQQSMQMVELRQKLTNAEVALQEKSAALATRDAALAEANRPVLPVRVTFRPGWMAQGLVASIRNVTDRPLNVIAELRETGEDDVHHISLALDANGTTEIGFAQGWTIKSGQSLTLFSSGYRSVTAFAP